MENGFSVSPSHIMEFLFCKRFTYFEHVLNIPEHQEKHFKVKKGREVHENKENENREYLRKRIGVVNKEIGVYLTNEFLRGEVDEVLFLADGSCAPLDYKFAEYKDTIFDTYKTQLACYALLIESNYNREVKKGFLVFTRSKNLLVEIELLQKEKNFAKKCCEEIIEIICENIFPKVKKMPNKCINCTYRNICTG